MYVYACNNYTIIFLKFMYVYSFACMFVSVYTSVIVFL